MSQLSLLDLFASRRRGRAHRRQQDSRASRAKLLSRLRRPTLEQLEGRWLLAADLEVIVNDTTDPIAASGTINYSITVRNNGDQAAADVQLSDAIPTNTSPVFFGQDTGPIFATSFNGTAFLANIASLAAGASATFTMQVSVNAATPNGTIISNVGAAVTSSADVNASNNTDTETTLVQSASVVDLEVVKSDSPAFVTAGGNLTYTITVHNLGALEAASVQLSDTVPTNTTFVSFTSPAGWSSSTPPVGGTGTVTSSIATLAAGATATFTMVVNVNASAGAGTNLSNTASVSTTSTDVNALNNSDTETTTVVTQADLQVNKADSPDPVAAGGNITYTITVANNGPSDAQTVALTDVVPTNTTFVSAMQTSGPVFTLASPPVGGTGTFGATIATLAAGASATFSLTVNINAGISSGTTITNTATASTTSVEANVVNNTAVETTLALDQLPAVDLEVVKADTPRSGRGWDQPHLHPDGHEPRNGGRAGRAA